MNAADIREIVRDVFGRHYKTEVLRNWVQFRCPLSPWTHQRGADSKPSAGISIHDTDVSIFNCLAGYTKVITRQGIKSIASLAGTSPELLMPDGTWLRAPVRDFGEQKLLEIRLSRNGRTTSIFATAGHRWFTRSGPHTFKERTTVELKKGMRLQYAIPQKRTDWNMDPTGVLHGLMFGDGTRAKYSPRHGRLNLFGECRDLALPLAQQHGLNATLGLETEQGTPYNAVSGPIGHMKVFPGGDFSDSYLLGFLSGLIAADGHVDERGNVSLASASLNTISKVKDVCARLGIAVFGVSGQVRMGLGTTKSTIHTLRFVSSSLVPEFFTLLHQQLRLAGRDVEYERLGWQVVEVVETRRYENVFCAEVPGYHAFVLDGNIVTGNCFTCGNKGPISSLLQRYARFTGENLDDLIAELEDEEYLGPRSLPSWEDRTDPTLHLPNLNKDIYLGLYDPAAGHPYLRDRGISDETANLLELRLDPEDPLDGEERILFPVYGLDGTLHGFSGRATNPGARLKVRDYYGLPKAFCVLGCHLIKPGEHKFIDLAEGLFDYANGWECGEPTVAVMHSTCTDAQIEILRNIGLPTYLFYDNDDAGQKGVEIAGEALALHQPVMRVRYPEQWIEDDSPEGGHWLKDPGELLPEEFQSMRADARLF